MRAHFANDVPVSPNADDALQQGHINVVEPQAKVAANEAKHLLQDRILEFKSDSSKMAAVGELVDDVLKKAEEEANRLQNDKYKSSQQGKNKTQKQNFKNGKVVNRARGFVVKLFESICNCANNAAAVPVTRFKFRSGKRTSSADATETNGKVESIKKEEKSKKSNNVCKNNDKVKIDDTDKIQEPIELE